MSTTQEWQIKRSKLTPHVVNCFVHSVQLTCLVWAWTPPSTRFPLAGSIPTCPETYRVRSTNTAWLQVRQYKQPVTYKKQANKQKNLLFSYRVAFNTTNVSNDWQFMQKNPKNINLKICSEVVFLPKCRHSCMSESHKKLSCKRWGLFLHCTKFRVQKEAQDPFMHEPHEERM